MAVNKKVLGLHLSQWTDIYLTILREKVRTENKKVLQAGVQAEKNNNLSL